MQPAAPALVDPLIGSMLGKDYLVLEEIGVGGMAVVYLVEHQTLQKRFAAKVLSPALASSLEARARFAQEAHAASQLDHEHIVSITDFGATVDHRPFFVMELLRGRTLDQRLAEGLMSLEEVVAVAVPVARALSHAHAEGIVHLDVKPENVFLVQRSQGRWGVKVVDFGISKTPLGPGLVGPEQTAGSPMFMSPEVCLGRDVDQRADVYSFGVLLYLMLCGRAPFVADSVQRILEMHVAEPPVPPRERNPELSPAIAHVVERALAKRPEDRYASMAALLAELEAALPPGAERLLIEAQTGARIGETPFAVGLPSRSQRASQPPPVESVPARAGRSLRVPIAVASAALVGVLGIAAWPRSTPALAPPADAAGRAAPALAATVAAPTAAPAAAVVAVAAPSVAPTPSIAAAPTPSATPAVALPTPVADARLATTVTRPSRHSAPAPRPTKRREPARRAPVEPAPAATAAPADSPAPAQAPARDELAADVAPTAPAEPTLAGLESAPAPTPVPAPPAAPPPAAPSIGSLDAAPAIASLDVRGSLSPAVVRRSLERKLDDLRACYRAAARAGNATPAVDLELRFEIDENSLATQVESARGFGSLAGCAASTARTIRTSEAPDVGTARVTAVIRFQPT